MRKIRIYTPQSIPTNQICKLEKNASHHLLNVLRLESGVSVTLFNGDGSDYHGKLIDTNKPHCQIMIDKKTINHCRSPATISLIQCIAKGDRMDQVVQKSTELGIDKLYPVYSRYCNVKLDHKRANRKLEHWKQISIHACEQCGRAVLPVIAALDSLEKTLTQLDATAIKLIANPTASKNISQLDTSTTEFIILVGPEGGFSQNELELARLSGFEDIGIGPRILRTETAPLAIISILQAKFGDY